MSALIEYIKQRSVSTLLISYSVFWIVCHWEGVYTTFFTSQDFIMEKYGMLKNEYVHKYFFGISQDNFANWILGIIIPAILAIIYVWVLPKILINTSYRREIKYKVDRKEMKMKEEKRLIVEERKRVEEKSRETEAKIELSKKEAEAATVDPKIGWLEDYKEFVSNNTTEAFATMMELRTSIYSHNGRIRASYGDDRYIAEDSLMLCDVNGLITFDKVNNTIIHLTDKGKYFLREFAKEKIG